MKGPRRLIEENELVASLVEDANAREPSAEALQKVLAVLDDLPAPAPGAPARPRARLHTPDPWIWLALVGGGALAVLGYSVLDRPGEQPVATVSVPAVAPLVDAPVPERAPEAVPSLSISELPDSKDTLSRSRVVAARSGGAQPSPTKVSPVAAAKPSTTRELELITRAREALTRGDVRACLAAISRHDADFPDGQFTPEAAVMRIEATHASGDRAGARTLADGFLARHPKSPYAARIRSLIAASEKE